MELESEKAPVSVCSPQHHRTGCVAEQDRAVAEARDHRLLLLGGRLAAAPEEEVPRGPRHEPGVDFRTDEQQRARFSRLEQGVGYLKAVDEPGALLSDVERRDVRY